MMGDIVAVCWNTHIETKTIQASGIEYTKPITTRSGDPYIDFVTINYDEENYKYYENEDCFVYGRH